MPSEPGCFHDIASARQRVCSHLLEDRNLDYIKRFTGVGLNHDLVCGPCAHQTDQSSVPLRGICAECFTSRERESDWFWTQGQPEVLHRLTDFRFEHEIVEIAALSGQRIVDLQPIVGARGNRWVMLTQAMNLLSVDLSDRSVSVLSMPPETGLDLDSRIEIKLSPNDRLAAFVNTYGQRGIVVDLTDARVLIKLDRGDRYNGLTPFPLAFATLNGTDILVHGTTCSRLDISEPCTARLLTARELIPWRQGEPCPPHYSDYYHGRLYISPDQEWIVDDGWAWHPSGLVRAWSLPRWLGENVWESEDGPSNQILCIRVYYWDGPMCWIDGRRLAVWGYGNDDDYMIPAIRLFDVGKKQEFQWFAGPDVSPRDKCGRQPDNWDPLIFDRFLFSVSKINGTSVWDIDTGERLLHDPAFRPDRYHQSSKRFVTSLGNGAFQLSRLVE